MRKGRGADIVYLRKDLIVFTIRYMPEAITSISVIGMIDNKIKSPVVASVISLNLFSGTRKP